MDRVRKVTIANSGANSFFFHFLLPEFPGYLLWSCRILVGSRIFLLEIQKNQTLRGYDNSNNLFHQESNTFGTVIFKYFTKRTHLPKRPPKSTQAFQGETFELKWSLEFIFFVCCVVEVRWFLQRFGFKKLSQPVHRYRKYTNLRFCVRNFAIAHLSSHVLHDR